MKEGRKEAMDELSNEGGKKLIHEGVQGGTERKVNGMRITKRMNETVFCRGSIDLPGAWPLDVAAMHVTPSTEWMNE